MYYMILWGGVVAKTDNFYSCLCVWIPDFQLRPTFSEQPPTNGVKTRLVKMCRSQYNCSISVFCGLRPRSQRLRGTKKVVNGRYPFNTSGAISQLSHNIKDTSLLWELRVFSLSVSQLRSKMVQSRKSCTNTLQKKQSVGETLSRFISLISRLCRRGYICLFCFYPPGAHITSLSRFSCCFCSFSSCSRLCCASHSSFIIRYRHKKT